MPYSKKELLSVGKPRVFKDRSLSQLAFPIGGIGTGTVSLGGRGNLQDWEIFNRPGKGKNLPYTFFAIRAKAVGRKPVAKVLAGPPQPPYTGSRGFKRTCGEGLPHMKKAIFTGTYPFANIEFSDSELPVHISLEAFNPFIPMNIDDSGLPVAIFSYRIFNPDKKPVKVTICLSMMNPIGTDGKKGFNGPCDVLYGKNLNEFLEEPPVCGIKMTSEKYSKDSPCFDSMAIGTDFPSVTYTLRWRKRDKWNGYQSFWDDFSSNGLLDSLPSEPSPERETHIGSLGAFAEIKPGEEKVLRFALSWYFPNRINEWNSEESVRGKPLRNYYATRFSDAWGVLQYAFKNLRRLEGDSRKFQKAFFSSTLPSYVLEAVSSQVSTIRTNTCMHLDDGKFYAFEGCYEEIGSCPMNCTHVWNYEQALAHLFPELEKTMRETDFLVNTKKNGYMPFRTLVPTGLCLWDFLPAADGQMGCIMKLYREWKISGDNEFLRKMWPNAKKSLEYAWKGKDKDGFGWDLDRDGVMEGHQWNTYDVEFFGPNTMVGTLYLGALRAAEEMARAMGDSDASLYHKLFEKGREKLEKLLWNGEYYIQKCNVKPLPKHQYLAGCLSDQLLGQWFAEVVGLGYLLKPNHIRKALSSIFKYNWKTDLFEHSNVQRIYALGDEKGLLICSWPKGGRPEVPLIYAHEVWTGIEYQVAAHLIYEGFIKEGLSIVKAIRERHNGIRRNPYNEPECGDHYARALSSWSVLLALSGFRYSAIEQSMEFSPKISQKNFSSFFSAGKAWGTFKQRISPKVQIAKVRLNYGNLTLKTFKVSLKMKKKGRKTFDVHLDKKVVDAKLKTEKDGYIVKFSEPLNLQASQTLVVRIKKR